MRFNSIACFFFGRDKNTYRIAKLQFFFLCRRRRRRPRPMCVYKRTLFKVLAHNIVYLWWWWWWWWVCNARAQTISIFLAFIFPSDIFHCSHWHRYAIVFLSHTHTRARTQTRAERMFMYSHWSDFFLSKNGIQSDVSATENNWTLLLFLN